MIYFLKMRTFDDNATIKILFTINLLRQNTIYNSFRKKTFSFD